jgi:hypothetical protein
MSCGCDEIRRELNYLIRVNPSSAIIEYIDKYENCISLKKMLRMTLSFVRKLQISNSLVLEISLRGIPRGTALPPLLSPVKSVPRHEINMHIMHCVKAIVL